MNQRERFQTIRSCLLRWFGRCARDLPWRRTRDIYAIWISEIMLQQTQTAAVEPYYRRFLRRFPDVHALARARLDSVLKAWEGLGYYSRARNLHRAARIIVKEHDGRLPRTREELLKLPGIGRYTAGAIASIAFGQNEPVLDGNVTRVLCRVLRISEDPRQAKTQQRLWQAAQKIIAAGRAGTLNQALMELGATICVPRRPRCDQCPLAGSCRALRSGEQENLPVRPAKKTLPHYTVAVGIVRKAGWILIDQRLPDGMLGGMWEFPGGKRQDGEPLEATVVREIREELGIRVAVQSRLAQVEHGYSHFRVTLHAFACRHESGRPRPLGCAACKWVRAKDLRRYAFPRGSRKIIEAMGT
ncbi:MAG: A/G-specific adenine glycosylase [Sedimentisphaerales bacterium]|nr:A/G-specific adenine glycosylase [Sedimentisphaerales bacterium]